MNNNESPYVLIANKAAEILEKTGIPMRWGVLSSLIKRDLPDYSEKLIDEALLYLPTIHREIIRTKKGDFALAKNAVGEELSEYQNTFTKVADRILEILENSTEGISVKEMTKIISSEFPKSPKSITWDVLRFIKRINPNLTSFGKGIYILSKYRENVSISYTIRDKVEKAALDILEQYPQGIKSSELVKKIKEKLPELKESSIAYGVKAMLKINPQITRPHRKYYILKKYGEDTVYQNFLKKQVLEKSLEILENHPGGIQARYLVKELKEKYFPNVPEVSIRTALIRVLILHTQVEKLTNGYYILKKYLYGQSPESLPNSDDFRKITSKFNDRLICVLFTDFLINELKEATTAYNLCGKKPKREWFIPDILGINRFSNNLVNNQEIEIISIALSCDIGHLAFAVGRTVSYKIFSHRIYILVPSEVENNEGKMNWLEIMTKKFGIGVVFYKKENHQVDFKVIIKPKTGTPDPSYVADYLQSVKRIIKRTSKVELLLEEALGH